MLVVVSASHSAISESPSRSCAMLVANPVIASLTTSIGKSTASTSQNATANELDAAGKRGAHPAVLDLDRPGPPGPARRRRGSPGR